MAGWRGGCNVIREELRIRGPLAQKVLNKLDSTRWGVAAGARLGIANLLPASSAAGGDPFSATKTEMAERENKPALY